ncbi:MAG: putative bifunctional diguanylate cyclase/phosphodiesterase [Geminicoccaceae bacterium]
MACVVQLGICLSIASLGFLLGLHVQFSDGLGATLTALAGLLAVLAIAATALGVWLAGAVRRLPERGQDALRAAEEKVHHLVRHDALTGLPNRGVFLERLCAALAGGRRGDRMTAVHCLDLTDFKAVNDTLGYAAGDLLLRHMSARLLASLRETDTLARMGPDEFAIIQADIEAPAGAARLCERLLTIMEDPFDLFGQATHVRANIGVALCPTDTRDPEQLLKQAGLALTRAKADGAQTFRFFEGTMDSELRQRKALEQDLHHALQRNEFEIHYQPQIDLATRTMVGVEALLRWHHPKHGLILPDRFIPLAEDTGLILPIGAWVLEQACNQARQWQRAGLPQFRMSVNLSPVQFRDPDLAVLVRGALERSGLAPDHLELEITERTLMEDTETNLAILRELKQLGVKISIDDFGVGHSSLGYLRRFTFDEIKLDRSFVAALEHDPSAAAIVRATLSLGHSLGLDAVAEGVESAEQLAMLDAEGCTLAQGYYFSPPVHVQEINSMVRALAEGRLDVSAVPAGAANG